MVLLTARDISVTVHGKRLLEAIDLQLECGEVAAVIGPNGAGKTSLIRALTGDLPLATGEVLLNDRHLDSYSLQEKAQQLALLPQQTELNFSFPVKDVVHLGRIPHASGQQIDNRIVNDTLRAVDMLDRAQQHYTWLSGGEKQRVQLARVMAQLWRAEDAPTRLLVLDEPTASLDVAHTRQLMQCIQSLAASGMGVIMVVHDFNLAARYADRVFLLKDGQLAVQGTPDAVLTREHMQRFFDVASTIMQHPQSGKPMVFIDD